MKKIFKNIMLVDDEEMTNLQNKHIIDKSEVAEKVTVIPSTINALQVIRVRLNSGGELPELILLDIMMPTMNGWQFVEEFCRLVDQKNCKTKIIMLTSGPVELKNSASKKYCRISGYKIKPFTDEMLHDIIAEYFEESYNEAV